MAVVGSGAAVADAGLYLYEGDPVSAALSLTAVVPGGAILAQGGRALKAVKGADKALAVVNEVNKTEKAIKGADEAVDVFNDVSKVEKAAKQADEAERLATDASRAEKSADDAERASKLVEAPGGNGALRDPKTGRFAPNPDRVPRVRSSGLHGNSLDSPLEATVYIRYDANGRYLKTGLTATARLGSRYSEKELAGGWLDPVARGARRAMIGLERNMVEIHPGPLNHEPWAGWLRRFR